MRALPLLVLAVSVAACTEEKSAPADCPDQSQRVVSVRFVNLYASALTVSLAGDAKSTEVGALESTTLTYRGAKGVASVGLAVAGSRYEVVGDATQVSAEEQTLALDVPDDAPLTVVARVNRIDSTPARISTNFTVAKQTQTQSFGERVQQGLAGVAVVDGVDLDGDCVADLGDTTGAKPLIALSDGSSAVCDSAALVFAQPAGFDDAVPYATMGDTGLVFAWLSPARSGPALTRPLADLYVVNAHPDHLPLTLSLEGEDLGTVEPGALLRTSIAKRVHAIHYGERATPPVLTASTTAGPYATFTFAQPDPGGAVYTGPCKPPYLCDFAVDEAALLVVGEGTSAATRVRWVPRPPWGWGDRVSTTARQVVPVSALDPALEVRACFAVFTGDDTCAMGATNAVSAVAAVGNLGGGASSASYAATGRVLPAMVPTAQDPAGLAPRFGMAERTLGAAPVRHVFDWNDGAGLNASGFAVLAKGTVVDPSAATQRVVLFVDTTTTPWTAKPPLLSR